MHFFENSRSKIGCFARKNVKNAYKNCINLSF